MVDAAPEATGETNVEVSSKPTGNKSVKDVETMFSISTPQDAPEETPDTSDDEVEEPASITEEETEPEVEEATEETEETESTEEEEESSLKDDNEPEWFKKRINKITAQRKEAEEKIAALEAKLQEVSDEPQKVATVETITDVKALEKLEQDALDAEDQVDAILDEEPEYNSDGDAYWKVGDKELSKSDLINIRKNARQTLRAIPKRKNFVAEQSKANEAVDSLPFFSDPEDPYYELAQATLKQPIYTELASKIPDAKAAVALMVRGKMAIDAEQAEAKKKTAKKTVIKSTPPKAPADTGTVAPASTPEDQSRKSRRKLLKSGNVNRKQAVDLFS